MKMISRMVLLLALGLALPQLGAQEEPEQRQRPDNGMKPGPRMERFNQPMDGVARGQNRPEPGPAQLLKRLQLPPEQAERLLGSMNDVRNRCNELRENIADVRRSLQEMANEDKINDEAIGDRAHKLAKLEAELALTRGKLIRELRQKLPPEKFEQLMRFLKNGPFAEPLPNRQNPPPGRWNRQPQGPADGFRQPSGPPRDFNPPQGPRFSGGNDRQDWKWKYKPNSPKADPETGFVKVPKKPKKAGSQFQPQSQPRNPRGE